MTKRDLVKMIPCFPTWLKVALASDIMGLMGENEHEIQDLLVPPPSLPLPLPPLHCIVL